MKKLLAIIALLPLILIGCGKNNQPGEENLKLQVGANSWFTSLGQTPIGAPSVYPTSKGDTITYPHTFWRTGGDDTAWFGNIDINDGEATIPIIVQWYDTLVVVYSYSNPTDTVRKPTPCFNGNLSFTYKAVDNKWEFYGLTPAEIQSDSAGNYVKIDSIQIKVGQEAKPTITSPEQLIEVENYPYDFNVEDTVTVTVYKSGTLSDDIAWVLLHVPAGDSVICNDSTGAFHNIAQGVWEGTWVLKKSHGYQWAWVDVFDIGVLIYKGQMAERTRLWGIPYKVE